MNKTIVSIGKVKKKFRVIVQERFAKSNKKEKSRSFMIYDYEGKSTVDSIKDDLMYR